MKGGYKLNEIDSLDIHFLFELHEGETEVRQATDEEIDQLM